MSDRCTGHCCRQLTIPASPDELRKDYEDWHQQKLLDWAGVPYELPNYRPEIHIIAPMLTHLGEFDAPPIEAVHSVEYPPGEKRHWYTCKHLIDNNCSIYEIRPTMCSDYPYSDDCNYADCTWDERKAKANPKLPVVEQL